MAHASTANVTFSQAEARGIVKDLFQPRPVWYWTDFLLSYAVGSVCFALVRRLPLLSWQQALTFVVSCLLYYRSALFIHELAHLRGGSFKAFRIVWNLLCGIPFLMPSFLYYMHVDHHRRKHYGTHHDGEYLPLGTRSRWTIVLYLLQSPLIPLLAVVRFGVLTPLCWISPMIRDWVRGHASSMVIDPTYVRPLPTAHTRRIWRMQEALVFGFIVLAAVLMIRGRVPWVLLLQAYLTGLFIVTLNSIRTIVAHRYLHDGEEMTFVEQLLDTMNFPHRPWFTEIWAPLGLRFHALHHLFPSLPYHNLGVAHRRLAAQLSPDNAYHRSECRGLLPAIADLWRRAGDAAWQRKDQRAVALSETRVGELGDVGQRGMSERGQQAG